MSNLARLPVPGETILYAHPYNLDARGFYFSTLEDYERLSSRCRDRFGNPVEEFEIQYIDGDDAALFNAVGMDQSNLSEWFDDVYLHEIPEAVRNYIDYEAWANDCQLNGDMHEFEHNGQVFTCTNHNGL